MSKIMFYVTRSSLPEEGGIQIHPEMSRNGLEWGKSIDQPQVAESA